MSILPFSLLLCGCLSLGRVGSVTNSCRCINGGCDGMCGNMRGRHRLPCGTGGRTGRIELFDLARSRMGRKRGSTDIGHMEYPRFHPNAYRFDGLSRTIILWRSFFKIM